MTPLHSANCNSIHVVRFYCFIISCYQSTRHQHSQLQINFLPEEKINWKIYNLLYQFIKNWWNQHMWCKELDFLNWIKNEKETDLLQRSKNKIQKVSNRILLFIQPITACFLAIGWKKINVWYNTFWIRFLLFFLIS